MMRVEKEVKHFGDYPNDAGFADVPETRTPIELKVTGNIPSYVRGVLYRTGPGSYTTPMNNGQLFKMQHWYDFTWMFIDLGLMDLHFNIDLRLLQRDVCSIVPDEHATNTSNIFKKQDLFQLRLDRKISARRCSINSSPRLRVSPPPFLTMLEMSRSLLPQISQSDPNLPPISLIETKRDSEIYTLKVTQMYFGHSILSPSILLKARITEKL